MLLAGLTIAAIRFFGIMGKAGNQMNATRTAAGLRSSVLAAAAGESYFKKGNVWHDLTEGNRSANFCIKALTDKI